MADDKKTPPVAIVALDVLDPEKDSEVELLKTATAYDNEQLEALVARLEEMRRAEVRRIAQLPVAERKQAWSRAAVAFGDFWHDVWAAAAKREGQKRS